MTCLALSCYARAALCPGGTSRLGHTSTLKMCRSFVQSCTSMRMGVSIERFHHRFSIGLGLLPLRTAHASVVRKAASSKKAPTVLANAYHQRASVDLTSKMAAYSS